MWILTKGFTMKIKQSNLITTLLCVTISLLIGIAQAQSLTQNDVDNYIKSIELFNLSDDPEIKSIESQLKSGDSFVLDTNEDGKFAVVSQMLDTLSDSQKDVLTSVTKQAGFSSLNTWATIADSTTSAMMALEMAKEPLDMSELTPEMIEMMPKEMRSQMESTLRLVTALKNVPKNDLELVKANYAKLSALADNY